jgi:hypothetical protein
VLVVYADRPVKAARQLLGDAIAVAIAYAGTRTALWVHEQVSRLALPGEQMERAGESLGGNLRSAADKIDGVPVVGDDVRKPLDAAGSAAAGLAQAGRDFQDTVADLALIAAVSVVVLPALVVLCWLAWRARWVTRALSVRRLVSLGDDPSLLALRALAGQPVGRLARMSKRLSRAGEPADLMAGWRRGDPVVVRSLAELELSSFGLRRLRT